MKAILFPLVGAVIWVGCDNQRSDNSDEVEILKARIEALKEEKIKTQIVGSSQATLISEPTVNLTRHYEQAGGFSFVPPSGWQARDLPGMKFKLWAGQPENDFAPNIVVVDEQFDGSFNDYVNENIKSAKVFFQKMTVIKRENFQTHQGKDAIFIVTQNRQQGKELRQSFFFFGNGNQKYVVTCSALKQGGATLDELFLKSMQTFQATSISESTANLTRHYEQAGGFSFVAPSGWQGKDLPGMKFKVWVGQPENDFAPNIVVVDEQFDGSLNDYVNENIKSLKVLFQKITIIKRENFQTHEGKDAIFIVTQNRQQGMELRQSLFFFGNGNQKHVVTCSALKQGGATLDELFLKSMQTFRVQ